eukprot:COSAG05_NODE_7273_length_834_cov_1.078912_1_plen_41_part_10
MVTACASAAIGAPCARACVDDAATTEIYKGEDALALDDALT